jgi:hypothetical protein
MSTAADSVMELTRLPQSSPTPAGIPKRTEGVPAWNVESIPTSRSGFLPQKAQFFFDESEKRRSTRFELYVGHSTRLRSEIVGTDDDQKLLNFMA